MRPLKIPAFLLLLALLAAACTSSPGAGTSEPTDAQATGEAASEPAGSAETSAEPEKSGSARIGFPSAAISVIPLMITVERLNEMGYDVEAVEFASTSTQMQAASQNEIDITTASAAATLTAIDAGLPNKFFLTRYMNEFLLVSRADLTSCDSLSGQVLAIHAPTDISGLLVNNYLEQNCPDAEPQIQIVEGSENRLAGLLQDQIDATVLDIQNSQLLFNERPDEFIVLANFPEEFPVLGGVYSASPEWLADNEELVKDFIRVHLEVTDEIYADPAMLVAEAEARLPEVDPAMLPAIVDEYIANEVFPLDGDLAEEETQFTIDFFAEAGDFANLGSFEDVADRSYLDEVLADR